MKNSFIHFIFILFLHPIFAQNKDFSKYNEQIQSVQNDVKFFEIEKINDQFYMLVGGGGNVGVFVTEKDVVLIDNKYEIIQEVVMSSLRTITDKPIKYMINTHFHHDHSDGNRAFGKQGIPIVSHQNAKKRMKKTAELYGGIYPSIDNFVQPKYESDALPVITYQSKMTLTEGNEDIELYNFGSAHTDGDSIVFFKQSNVMHTGDAFVRYGYPYVDLNNGGSIKGLIELLGKLEQLCNNKTIIMPGHGQISSKKDITQLKNSLSNLYKKTVVGLKNGLSKEEIADSIEETLNNEKTVKMNYIQSIELELSRNP